MIIYSAAIDQELKDDIRELKKLDQNILYDALKHENVQDHIELDEEEKRFLSHVTKGKHLRVYKF